MFGVIKWTLFKTTKVVVTGAGLWYLFQWATRSSS